MLASGGRVRFGENPKNPEKDAKGTPWLRTETYMWSAAPTAVIESALPMDKGGDA